MKIRTLSAFALASSLLTMPSLLGAKDCADIVYRLWSPQETHFFEAGETVELEAGETWDLYVHYRSSSENPYSTKSAISYAETFGLRGASPQSVVKILGLEKQSDKDLAGGKMTLTGRQAGSTQLGYKMMWVDKSGLFDSMPASCKSGLIPIQVRAAGSQQAGGDKPGDGAATDLETYKAADQLLSRVYIGLLRRPGAGEMSDEHLKMVVEKGHRGAVLSAVALSTSDEFQALNPAKNQARDSRYGASQNNGRDPRYDATGHLNLLSSMYTDLYGTTQIAMEDHQRNVKALWDCFNDTAEGRDACKRFARDLLKSEHFSTHQKALIEQLPESYNRERK